MRKKLSLPEKWGLPWERRHWAFYLPGTKKLIFEIRLSYKSSKDCDQIADYIQNALNFYEAHKNGRVG